MTEHIVHFVGNRSPSLYGTILIDGVAVNLTGSTVKFQMRAVASAVLKVDTSAVTVAPTLGTVRYDWNATDVDTAGDYVGWWRVTNGAGLIQDTPEFLLEVRAHAAAGNEYVTVAELKETLSLSGVTFADSDLSDAVMAASRFVDGVTGTQFYLGAPGEVRKYTPVSDSYLLIEPATSITAVTASGAALVLDTDYAKQTIPGWTVTTNLRSLGTSFPKGTTNGMTVTGTFGWAAPPPDVKQATTILASRLLKRAREAAFGVVGFGLEGGVMQISSFDPDVDMLLAPYVRSGMIE